MTTPQSPLIQLTGIGKIFLTDDVETHALSNVHLTIDKGEFLSIAGPSGSGKTTLLSILGLVEVPTSGHYILAGDDVSHLDARERAHRRNRLVGFIFQSFNLIGDLTAEENVELPLRYRRMDAAERRKRVTDALERVGMSNRRRHLPAQLSGGQQQRVAVARAVAGDPLLLLADEPTGNLDSRNGEAVMSLLIQLHQQGSTVCMVTHNPSYTRYATRSVQLSDGNIVDEQRASAA